MKAKIKVDAIDSCRLPSGFKNGDCISFSLQDFLNMDSQLKIKVKTEATEAELLSFFLDEASPETAEDIVFIEKALREQELNPGRLFIVTDRNSVGPTLIKPGETDPAIHLNIREVLFRNIFSNILMEGAIYGNEANYLIAVEKNDCSAYTLCNSKMKLIKHGEYYSLLKEWRNKGYITADMD